MHTATDPIDYVLANDAGQLSGGVSRAELSRLVCLTWAEVGLPVLHINKLAILVPSGSYIHPVSVFLLISF